MLQTAIQSVAVSSGSTVSGIARIGQGGWLGVRGNVVTSCSIGFQVATDVLSASFMSLMNSGGSGNLTWNAGSGNSAIILATPTPFEYVRLLMSVAQSSGSNFAFSTRL